LGFTNTDVPVEKETYGFCRDVADALTLIGDRWTIMVIAAVSDAGTMRYNEIRRHLEGISQRMLTLTLRELEQDGLIRRTVYATVPPRVDYALTELGQSLVAPLRALYKWAELHRGQMHASRKQFLEERERERLKK